MMPTPVNPYIAGKPVGKTPNFIGREDVLRQIERFLRNPHQHAITIYGQRRVGKTSILQYLETNLPQQGAYIPVLFDLMPLADVRLDRVLHELAHKIAHHLKLSEPNLASPLTESFRTTFLPGLREHLAPQAMLVLLFDEFDILADPQYRNEGRNEDRNEGRRRILRYLHELFQLQSEQPWLKFVLTLGRNIEDLDIFVHGLLKDVQNIRVSFLTEQDTIALIRISERDGSLQWNDDAVQAVWRLTGGHPFLTQALCSQVWEAAYERSDTPQPVRASDVAAAVEQTLEASTHAFEWIWGGLGAAEKVAAAALAGLGPDCVDEDQLVKRLNDSGIRIALRELRDAPEKLEEWDILTTSNGGYRFRVELLRQWIATRKPLDRTWNELDRIIPLADNRYEAARLLYQSQQYQEAEADVRQAIKLNPNHMGALELLAELLLMDNRLDEAQQTLENLFDIAPGRAYPRLKQVYLDQLQHAANLEQQRAIVDRAARRIPDDPDIRTERSNLYRQIGADHEAQDRLAEALQAYEQAADEQAILRVRTRIRQHEVQQALAELALLRRYPDYTTARSRIQAFMEAYPADHNWQHELETVERAIRLDECYRQALDALQQHDRVAAKRLLAEVIALDPDYEEASRYLYQAVTGSDPKSELEQRDATINRQQQDLDQRDATIARLQHDLEQRDATISRQQHELEQRDATISRQQRDLEQRNASIVRPQAEPEERKEQARSGRTLPQLSRWNPFDGLRLLWWIFMQPELIDEYRAAYGKTVLRPVADRLVYLLSFGPLLILALGLGLKLVGDPPDLFLWTPLVVSLIWLLCWLLNERLHDRLDNVAYGVAVVVAYSVAGGVAGGVAVGVMHLGEKAASKRQARPWLLGVLILSWLYLLFASSGGLVWLSSGRWPRPVWPF